MRKIFAMIASILMVVALTGCAPKDDKVDFNVEEVVNTMVEEMWGEGMAFPYPLEQLVENGDLDGELVSEFAGIGGSMIDANRLMLFEVKDMKDIDAVLAVAKQQQEMLINSFKQYLPGPLVVAEASQVITRGKYVLFISHENIDDAIAIFNAQFGK